MSDTLLDIDDLSVRFATAAADVDAVRHVSIDVERGETVALVGESGSGKSVTMMSLMGLLPMPPAEVTGGEVLYQGRDVLKMGDEERRRLRDNGVTCERIPGTRATEEDWLFFNKCYRRTYREHHSTPYLNLNFFRRIGETIP